VRTRPGLDIDDIEARLEVALPGAAIDYNHIYRADSSDPRAFGGFMPASFFGETGASRGRGAKIGMIDTAVRTDHPALEDTRIETRDFVKSTAQRPEAHGTAVASILVGAADAYQGLAPRAKLYAASVFSKHSASGQITTAASLVRALDWIASERVDVLNMSLSGPANAVLKSAIDAATARGIVIVAASGNDGPAARPVYPAGYDNVIAVTAVDSKSRVYRLAGRGDHVDVAAPGVEIIVAAPDGGYDLQTGTSFAAPFASASIALQCKSPKNCRGALAMETLVDKIVDLGAPGHDPVYGHGLISP
jgi:subtilisin family serine protease